MERTEKTSPAPWRVERTLGCKRIEACVGRRAADGKRKWEEVACTPGLYCEEEDLANARVMAASPELRDALKRCTELLASATGLPPKEVATALAAANAALAKAEFGR
jgi:hypothetical protein